MTEPQTLFDSARIARFHTRARPQAHKHAFLRQRTFDDILLRLQSINRSFDRGVLVSPFALDADVVPAFFMQRKTWGTQNPQSLDLLVSLLHLHSENDLPGVLQKICRSLRPDGLFLGALFGERTLHELRHALLQAESEHTGAQARIIPFAEIRALGGLMQRAGFALPVVDVDRVTARYANVRALMHELRGMGQSNSLMGPLRPLRRDVLGRVEEIYRERYGEENERIPATFEIVHLCGWAPHESQQKPLKPGSAEVSLKKILGKKAPL